MSGVRGLGGIHHVSLNVDDAEAGRAFYQDVLGLALLERPDLGIPGYWLDAGDFQIHLIEIPGNGLSDSAGNRFASSVGMQSNTSGGAVAFLSSGAQTWNSDFTFTGSNALDMGSGDWYI